MAEVTKANLYVAAGTPTTQAAVSKLVMYVCTTNELAVPVPRRSRATVRTRMGVA